jgi:hypothetical protein
MTIGGLRLALSFEERTMPIELPSRQYEIIQRMAYGERLRSVGNFKYELGDVRDSVDSLAVQELLQHNHIEPIEGVSLEYRLVRELRDYSIRPRRTKR